MNEVEGRSASRLRLRVLLVTPHYPPRRLGGTQLRARKLALWLSEHGYPVTVVCVESVSPGDRDKISHVHHDTHEGIQVHRLHLVHTGSLATGRHEYEHPGITSYLHQAVNEWQPDVVHLISGYLVTACAIEVAHALGIPAVVTLTDYWFICPRINLIRSNGQVCSGPHNTLDCTRCLLSDSRRYRLPERLLPGLADLIWRTLSRQDGLKQHIPLYQQVARRESFLVGLLNKAHAVTIPTNSLRPRLARAGVQDRFVLSRHGLVAEDAGIEPGKLKSRSSCIRFGYMGQVLHSKGVDLLVEAYLQLNAEYENVSLTIWGDITSQPAYVTTLETLLGQRAGATIRGRYEPWQVGTLLRDIDVLVVPSRWPEIGPFTILEAFAAKTPVVAARTGNMPELVEPGVGGLLFDPDSASDLLMQMRRIIREPQLLELLTSSVPAVRTHEQEMAEILAVYKSVREQQNAMAEVAWRGGGA